MASEEKTRRYLNTFVRTSIFVLFSILLSKVFTYAYKITIARHFGAEVYGNFSLAIIVTGFFIAFASLGFSDGLVRYISYYLGKKDVSRIKYFVIFSVKIMIISGLLGGFVLFFSADYISRYFFHNVEISIYLKTFSLIVPLSLLGSLAIALLRSYEKAKTASFIVGIFHNGVRFLLLVALIFMGLRLNSLLYSYIISYVLVVFVALYFARKNLRDISHSADSLSATEKGSLRRDIFSYSWPLIFVGLLFSMFYWIDSLVLGYFADATVVGYYSAAATLAGLFIMAPDLFSQLFLPIVSKELSRKNGSVIRNITKQITKWIYMINIPLFAALFVFPGVVLNLFFGQEFVAAQIPLRILAVGGLFSSFINTFTALLSAKKKTKMILYNFGIFSALNLAINLLLIRFGMIGVSIATTLCWIGFYSALFFQIRRQYGFYPLQKATLRMTVASLFLVGILYLSAQQFSATLMGMIGAMILFCVGYLGVLFTTRALDERDWLIVSDLKTKLTRNSGPLTRSSQNE